MWRDYCSLAVRQNATAEIAETFSPMQAMDLEMTSSKVAVEAAATESVREAHPPPSPNAKTPDHVAFVTAYLLYLGR